MHQQTAQKFPFTIDPKLAEYLGITLPSQEALSKAIQDKNFSQIPFYSRRMKKLGSAGNGAYAGESTAAGSVLPYEGNIEFTACNKHHKYISCVLLKEEQYKLTSVATTPEISMLSCDEEKIVQKHLENIKDNIRQHVFTNPFEIKSPNHLIWHAPTKTWHLVMPKQITNAISILLTKLPELIEALNKAGIDIINLSYEEMLKKSEKTQKIQEFLTKYLQNNNENSTHPCFTACTRLILGINGENAPSPSAADIQHCYQEDFTSVTNGPNMHPVSIQVPGCPLHFIYYATTQDIPKGQLFTCDYGPVTEQFIPPHQMIIWDKQGEPINPCHAFRMPLLQMLRQSQDPFFIYQELESCGADELWIIIKKHPEVFKQLYQIANNNSIHQSIQESLRDEANSIKVANTIYANRISNLSPKFSHKSDMISLLPEKLNGFESRQFFNSPHSALHLLRNPEAVKKMRESAKTPTFNWYRTLKFMDHIDVSVSQEKQLSHCEKNRQNYTAAAEICYNVKTKEYAEKSIPFWQEALGFATIEAFYRYKNSEDTSNFRNYQHNIKLWVNLEIFKIFWNLAKAYQNIAEQYADDQTEKYSLYEEAIYFFNKIENLLRIKPEWSNDECNLPAVRSLSHACRQKLLPTQGFGSHPNRMSNEQRPVQTPVQPEEVIEENTSEMTCNQQ